MTTSTPSLEDATAEPADAVPDRRRPGRAEHVHPSLIDMLRRRGGSPKPEDENPETTDLPADDRAAAIGILTGAVSGMALWALGASVGWLM